MKLKIISLFDGIGGAAQALKEMQVDCIYQASEIDKYAKQVFAKNHPQHESVGDVKNWRIWANANIDLIIGGSPCQDLSIAKKDRKGLDGERSGLFYVYAEMVKAVKPKYFVLENVASMSHSARDIITQEMFGIEPVMINSALLTAQTRKRYYWVGEKVGDTYIKVNVAQPKDRGVLLHDILESGLPYLEKAQTLTASYSRAVFKDSLQRHRKTLIAEPVICASRGRYNSDGSTSQKLEPNFSGKTNTLTSVAKDNLVIEPIRIGQYGKGGQGGRIYSVEGKSVCLSANGGGGGAKTGLYKINLPNGNYTIRKLTPKECARLQGFPDEYCSILSDTQAYKCYGNSFTVPVIKHILEHLKII